MKGNARVYARTSNASAIGSDPSSKLTWLLEFRDQKLSRVKEEGEEITCQLAVKDSAHANEAQDS